jgi:carbon-monoxide dehydrogenase medium subunit
MKPARFSYRRAESVEEAVAHLQELGDEAKVLAGGQSLVPMMNLRLARPTALVDINGIPGLAGIRFLADGQLELGALVRHRHLETYPSPLPGFSLLPRAARFIGHYGVRDRGSFGGSIAHADSTAEWCLVAALFDAELHMVGPGGGTRAVAARDFFQGFLSTALQPDEVLTVIRFGRGATRSAIQEFAQRHGDFAVVAVAVAFDLDAGRCRRSRIVVGGVDGRPLRVDDAEKLLDGQAPTAALFAEVADVVTRTIDPPSDSHASADYRRELARTLVLRALTQAASGEPDSAAERDSGAAA